jgi:pimeloyl-ACP methyl ester carboxylesterase
MLATVDGPTSADGTILTLDTGRVPPPDPDAAPESFVVVVDAVDRIAFHDWGPGRQGPPILLIHGLSATAWTWAPVARRLAALRRVVAMDLRGHGISDAPTHGYEPDSLAEDAIAVADGAGMREAGPVVVAGHGFGAIVAAWTAAVLGDACEGLILVDGGWEEAEDATGADAVEFRRTLAEPPEVLRSMATWLADRRSFDPSSWDLDQERAARDAVVELPVGRVALATRPHVVDACVEAMFAYRPSIVLPSVEAPIVALRAADDDDGTHRRTFASAQEALIAAGRPAMRNVRLADSGHNLMRYRPVEVAAALLAVGQAG